MSSWLLASAQLRHRHCGYLGSESQDEFRLISLSLLLTLDKMEEKKEKRRTTRGRGEGGGGRRKEEIRKGHRKRNTTL